MMQSYSNWKIDFPLIQRARSKSDFQTSDLLLPVLQKNQSVKRKDKKQKKLVSKKQVWSAEKYALNVLKMTVTQFERYKHAFGLFDLSDTGKISKIEFERVLGYFGLADDVSQSSVRECFLTLDRDGNKTFNLNDFLRELNNQKMFRLLTQFVHGILAKEKEINEYRKELGKLPKFEVQVLAEELEEEIEDESEDEYELGNEVIQANPQAYARVILKISDEDYQKFSKAFNLIDFRRSGVITKDRFFETMENYCFGNDLTSGELNFLFNSIDQNFDGEISFLDFLKSVKRLGSKKICYLVDHLLDVAASRGALNEEDEKIVFKDDTNEQNEEKLKIGEAALYAKEVLKLDQESVDKLGGILELFSFNEQKFVTKEPFCQVAQALCTEKGVESREIENLFDEVDQDNDGKITLDDVLNGFKLDRFNHIISKVFGRGSAERAKGQKDEEEEDLIAVPKSEDELGHLPTREVTDENRTNQASQTLDEEFHQTLKSVDHEVHEFNEQIQKDIEIVEEDHRHEIDILQEKIHQKDDLLQMRIRENDQLRTEKEEYVQEMDDLKERIRNLENNLRHVNGERTERERETTNKERELQELVERLRKDIQKKEDRAERMNKELKEYRDLIEINQDFAEKIDMLKKQVDLFEQDKRSWEEERNVLNLNIQKLEKERALANSKLSEMKNDMNLIHSNEDKRKKSQVEALCLQSKGGVESTLSELEKERAQLCETCQKVEKSLKEINQDFNAVEPKINRIDMFITEEAKSLRKENEWLWTQIKEIQGLQKESQEAKLKKQETEEKNTQKPWKEEYDKKSLLPSQSEEKLKMGNHLLQNKISVLQEELMHSRSQLFHLQQLQSRLTPENENLKNRLMEAKKEKNKFLFEINLLSKKENDLRVDYERMQLEHQSMKVRNMILEDKLDILQKHKTSHNLENYLKRIRELQKDNIDLRQQVDELRNEYLQRTKFQARREFQQQDKENINTMNQSQTHAQFQTPETTKGLLSNTNHDASETFERLKDELQRARISREAILNSLETERSHIRGILQETTANLTQKEMSLEIQDQTKKNLFKEFSKGENLESMTEGKLVESHETMTNHSAPATVKKAGRSNPRYFESGENTLRAPFDKSQEKSKISKFAFQTLYWLTDEALLTKALCSIKELENCDEKLKGIQDILQNVHIYAEKARSYYHNLGENEETLSVYEFILPLFEKCFQSHDQLKEIQKGMMGDYTKTI